jgi:hypothetical protein
MSDSDKNTQVVREVNKSITFHNWQATDHYGGWASSDVKEDTRLRAIIVVPLHNTISSNSITAQSPNHMIMPLEMYDQRDADSVTHC